MNRRRPENHQARGKAHRGCSGENELLKHNTCTGGKLWIQQRKDPVSYTHLDVYKRQDEDKQLTAQALTGADRIFSAYILPTGQKVWVITEWDRSATTFLLPDEY